MPALPDYIPEAVIGIITKLDDEQKEQFQTYLDTLDATALRTLTAQLDNILAEVKWCSHLRANGRLRASPQASELQHHQV